MLPISKGRALRAAGWPGNSWRWLGQRGQRVQRGQRGASPVLRESKARQDDIVRFASASREQSETWQLTVLHLRNAQYKRTNRKRLDCATLRLGDPFVPFEPFDPFALTIPGIPLAIWWPRSAQCPTKQKKSGSRMATALFHSALSPCVRFIRQPAGPQVHLRTRRTP